MMNSLVLTIILFISLFVGAVLSSEPIGMVIYSTIVFISLTMVTILQYLWTEQLYKDLKKEGIT